MIRKFKTGKESPAKRRGLASLDTIPPIFDSDALSAALFDDHFTSSLGGAVSEVNEKKAERNSSAKSRAEDFDRFMEEDASVAFIVQESIKPGSLVDNVQQSRGVDIVDREISLQKEAADRRKSRQVSSIKGKAAVVLNPKANLTRKVKAVSRSTTLKSKMSPQSLHKKTKTKASTLLTREQEYALAYTIQAGTVVHKLKAEHESSNGAPLSKKDWASLAKLSEKELRKIVSEYRSAKQELVSSNMGLVHAVTRSYTGKARYRGMPVEELVQEGTLGLIRAAELFDPAKGLRFSTYATIWIKGVLSNSNSLDDVITLPSREKVLWNKVRGAWDEMGAEAGERSNVGRGKPSVSSAKEIAERLGMKASLVEKHMLRMGCVSNVLSLDYQYATTTRSGYADSTQEALMNVAAFGVDADLAEQTQFKADVVSGLVRNLTEREVTLMRLRYGLGEDGKEYTVKECAAKMGINRETARMLQHACLKKLREASNMESLQEYLLTVA